MEKCKMIKEKIINFLENGYLANILTIGGVFVAYLTFLEQIYHSHLWLLREFCLGHVVM